MSSLFDHEIIKQLHSGGRSRVYRARAADGTALIVKKPNQQFPSFQQLAQFKREYAIARRCRHPGVVHPLALQLHGGRWTMIQEDTGGQALDQILRAQVAARSTPAQPALALDDFFDIALQLFDASGKLIASANPVGDLNASLSVNLALPGTYYLSVQGAGNGDPLKTGYSKYGSIGQYSISGSAALVVIVPPVAAPKASVISGKGPLTVSFSGAGTASTGATVTGYQWSFGDGTALATTLNASHVYTKVGTYEAVLKITDSRGQSASKGVVITVTAK